MFGSDCDVFSCGSVARVLVAGLLVAGVLVADLHLS